jgi:hypothetical protein
VVQLAEGQPVRYSRLTSLGAIRNDVRGVEQFGVA